jgi:short-subunit dehydrogenase
MLPWLKAQPQAAIVNIGSAFGSIPFAGFAAYSAAKAGLRGFSQALRRELADTRVDVIHLAPRAIDTPLNSPASTPSTAPWATAATPRKPRRRKSSKSSGAATGNVISASRKACLPG